MSKKNWINFIKKQWILTWLIVASVAMVGVISFAAYKEANNKIKRVFAPSASLGKLFTSNYLMLGTSINSKSSYYDEDESGPYSFDVMVRNYNSADPDTIYNGTISYTLKVELAYFNGTLYSEILENGTDEEKSKAGSDLADMVTAGASITITNGTETFTLQGTYDSGTATYTNLTHTFGVPTTYDLSANHKFDNWSVSFNNIELDSNLYCIKMTAHPTNDDLDDITAIINVATRPVEHPQSWQGEFTDAVKDRNNEDISISQYDGYNYSITGTGEKWLYFSYDPTKLEINPFFAETSTHITKYETYKGGSSGHTGWHTVEIYANPDSDDATLANIYRYDFQLYKVYPFDPSGAGYADSTTASDCFSWMENNCIELIQSTSQH